MWALLGMQHMALATDFSSLSNMKCNKICQKSNFSFDIEWISKYRVVSSKTVAVEDFGTGDERDMNYLAKYFVYIIYL